MKASPQASAVATARIKAILDCPEAAGESDLAQHLAFYTTLTVDQSRESLRIAQQTRRATAIMALPEAQGRTETAERLAHHTTVSVDEARGILALTHSPLARAEIDFKRASAEIAKQVYGEPAKLTAADLDPAAVYARFSKTDQVPTGQR